MSQCLRCFISGRVQGVWYRASTRQKANQLDVTGYARNLPDGRVEVLMCGNPGQLDKLKDWCWQGPSAAQVTDIQCEVMDVPGKLPEIFVAK
jgi:acylphosphatase